MRPAPLLLLGLERSIFSLLWRYIVCMCNPPFSLQQQGTHTHTLGHVCASTHSFSALTSFNKRHTKNNWNGLRIRSTNRPTHTHTHDTNTLSMHGFHTHAQSRLRNTLVHTVFLPANLHPAAVRTSCDWFVLSVSMSAHILTRPRACTVSGINSPCVPVLIQFGSPLCLLLCNAKATCSFSCSLFCTQGSALYYTRTHALQQWNAIYRPAPQGQIRLLCRENKFTFFISYVGCL